MSAVVKRVPIETATPRTIPLGESIAFACFVFVLMVGCFCIGVSVGENHGRAIGRAAGRSDTLAAMKRARLIPEFDGYTDYCVTPGGLQ